MYIYLITNLVNDKKYVGQTIRDPKIRWKEHTSDTNNESQFNIHRSMNKHGIDNFQFKVIDESATNINELNDLEEFYISFYDTFKGQGYNMTSGGESKSGWNHSEETKQKISKANTGKIRSEKARQNISEAAKGRIPWNKDKSECYSEETKRKMSVHAIGNTYVLGRKHSKEECIKMSVPVLQFDKNGIFLNEYKSITEAHNITKVQRSLISAVCKGKRKTTGGFVWKYKNGKGKSKYDG